MLGEYSDQRGLWEADRLYLGHMGRDTFYGLRGRLFRGEDFPVLYCADNGRANMPPSLPATALLLQIHDKVSDAYAGNYSARAASTSGVKLTGGYIADNYRYHRRLVLRSG